MGNALKGKGQGKMNAHGWGAVQESRWVVGTLDVVPVETALPPGSHLIPVHDRDWQVRPAPVALLCSCLRCQAGQLLTSLWAWR